MRQTQRAMAVVAAAGLLLAACGGGEETSSDEFGSPAAGTASSSESSGAGAGSGAPTTAAELANYDGAGRTEALLQCAQAEGGTLMYYTAQNSDLWEALEEGFESTYSGLDLEVYRGKTSEVVERVTQEGQASKNLVDVIDVKVQEMGSLREYLGNYISPQSENYNERAIDEQGQYVVSDRVPYGMTYNTDLVSEEEVPQSSEDLLDERWSDEMALSSTLSGTLWVGLLERTHGEEFIEDIGAQGIRTQAISSDAIAEMVAAGEASLTPSASLAGTRELAEKGAPVAWKPVGVYWADGSIALAANPPHPCSGMLFIDYALSKEGQTVSPSYISAREDVEPDEVLAGLEPLDINQMLDGDDYGEAYDRWASLLEEHIIGG